MSNEYIKTQHLYNTPVEIAARLLIIINELRSENADQEKLMYLDYLSLHTGDVGGEISVHAPIPNRGVQVYSKSELIKSSLTLLLSKELIDFISSEDGFVYSKNELTEAFLNYFQSDYFIELSRRVKWVIATFGNKSNAELREYIDENIQSWGGEFIG